MCKNTAVVAAALRVIACFCALTATTTTGFSLGKTAIRCSLLAPDSILVAQKRACSSWLVLRRSRGLFRFALRVPGKPESEAGSMAATAAARSGSRRLGKLLPSSTVFFLCDIQERFRPLIYNMEAVTSSARCLHKNVPALLLVLLYCITIGTTSFF